MSPAPSIEITRPVDLCRPDGKLADDAVGWSRRPLHRCNLRGRWLAKKRWNYWAVTTETHLLSATISSLDYAGVVFVYLADLERGTVVEETVVTPFGRGCTLPDTVDASLEFSSRRLAVALTATPTGTRLRVQAPAFGGRPLDADIAITRPPAHETLNVVVPWNRRTFQFTSKQNTLPAEGLVRWGNESIVFHGPQSYACLDFGRGVWPRRCKWNWGAGSGQRRGRTVGINLGGQWTDGTGATENAICVDGRLTKIHEDLRWTYDRREWTRAWRVVTPGSPTVDLTFTPILERAARTNTGLIRSEVHQLLGRWNGTVRSADGVMVPVDGIPGWAEDHVARW